MQSRSSAQSARAVGTCIATAGFLSPSASAWGQIYSWKDFQRGQRQLSTSAPPWYSPYDDVRGPFVLVTPDRRVVADTSLPLSVRLRIAGWAEEVIAGRMAAVQKNV